MTTTERCNRRKMLKRYHALRLIKEIFGTKHGCEEKK